MTAWIPLFFCGAALAQPEKPSGDGVLQGKFGSSEIVITTTRRLAGAVHSLTWNGKEFIDSHDHGRQLQSASSFDAGSKLPFWAECFNPTEAGSRADGTGAKSTSRLLSYRAQGNELTTTTQMAFWLAPGERSDGRPALNNNILSNHRVTKRIRIGYKNRPNILECEIAFTVPADEKHSYAQFEALTGYMPAEFSEFHKFHREKGQLEALDDGPGEQGCPVVLSTKSGSHAMGVFSPDQPSKGYEQAGYGRFRFRSEKVVKWNCVFRLHASAGIPVGPHRFRLFVPMGTRSDVRDSLDWLSREFAPN